MKTFSEHAKITDDKVFFVVCVNEDVQEMAKDYIGRELTPKELEIAFDSFNDNLQWRDELSECITEAVKEVA